MRSILFADPDRDLLSSCGELLRQDGYDVTAVFDGTQVIEKLAEKSFDLAMMNGTLPRISTDRLMPLLQEKHIPVLILGSAEKAPGAAAELSFPFIPSELKSVVGRLLPESAEKETGEQS